jgi:hypothetical protein
VASADEAKAYDIFHVGVPSGWYPAGIFADVALQLVPAVRIENVVVRPSVREQSVGVELEVITTGRSPRRSSCETTCVRATERPRQCVWATRR